MKKQVLINLVSVIAGLGGGFLAAQNSSQPHETEKPLAETRTFARFSTGEKAGKPRKNPAHDETVSGHALLVWLKYGHFTVGQLQEEFHKQLAIIAEQKYFYSPEMAAICAKWGEMAPLQAMAELEKAGSRYSEWKKNILEGWARRDPIAAMAYYLENRGELYRGGSLSGIMRHYSEQMPDKAWELLGSLSSQERKTGIQSCLTGILAGNPERMKEFLARLTDADWQGGTAYSDFLAEWSRTDADNYAEWLQDQPEERRQGIIASSCVEFLTTEDPLLAGKMFSELSAEAQKSAYDRGLWKMFEKLGTAGAFDWIITHSSEELVLETVKRNTGMIVNRDFNDMLRYVESMETGEVRNTLLNKLATLPPPEGADYQKMISLAETLPDSSEKNSSMKKMIGNWLQTDYDSASAWLDHSSLSPGEKAEMKNNLPQTGKTWIK